MTDSGDSVQTRISSIWQQMANGRFGLAEFELGHLLLANPGSPAVLAALADLHYAMRNMLQATRCAESAAMALSAHASFFELLYVSKMLRSVGEDEAANELARKCLPIAATDSHQRAALADHMFNLDLIDESLQLYEQAAHTALDDQQMARFGMAKLYAGDVAGAIEQFIAALHRNPDNANAALQLSLLGVSEGRERRIRQWRSRLDDSIAVDDRAQLNFALFNEYDAADDTKAATEALDTANALIANAQKYDLRLEQVAVYNYLNQLSDMDFELPPMADSESPVPVFIVGLPRTGTTLLEKSLTALADLQAVGEHLSFRKSIERQLGRVFTSPFEIGNMPFGGHLDFNELGRRYRKTTVWRANGRRYYSDKQNFNFAYVGQIAKALPEARILHIRRNPMDACFSALKQTFAAGAYPASFASHTMAAYYRNYARVMAFWREALGERMLEIRYEDMVLRHEETRARIKAYCRFGDAPADAASRPFRASTLSAAQVQKPIHAGNINAWAKYAEYLQPLRQALDAEYTGYMREIEGVEIL